MPKRPSRSLAARNAWCLAALLPAIALLCWRAGPALPASFALALLAALAIEAATLKLRKQPLAPFLREGSAVTIALALLLWLPALAGWKLVLVLFVALALARQAFGGLGRNLLHPLAVGVACAQLLAVPPPSPQADLALALPCLLGGLLLMGLRIVRWQAPLGLLAGAACGLLASGGSLETLAQPAWLLAAFFVAGDPVTTAEDPRARALAAGLAGLGAGLAGAIAPALLPFALLAMNAATPALDAWLPPRRMRVARQ